MHHCWRKVDDYWENVSCLIVIKTLIAHLENKVLSSGLNFLPKLYLRYVYDIFAVFPNDKFCTKFLGLLNAQQKNYKFTVEHANETIPFLDVEIKLTDSGVDTWVGGNPQTLTFYPISKRFVH